MRSGARVRTNLRAITFYANAKNPSGGRFDLVSDVLQQ